tara:strand:- start:143 stop:1024 length:882 start_codon:yes stop_codon:yes gene_type:complete
MKIYLTTFYSSDLKRSADRFKEQAEKMQIYDKIFMFTQNDLNEDFKEYVNTLLKLGKKRGYGYWVWQTYFHKKVLSEINEGDIYHWCDVGCHFNINGKLRLMEYFDILKKESTGFLGFQYKNPEFKDAPKNYIYPNYIENQYTKSDLVKYFKLNKNDSMMKTPQVWGGSFFIRKCKKSLEMMDEHYQITRNRFDLIDDDESKFVEEKVPEFVQHRHSQSVLSLIVKKAGSTLLSAYESEWALNDKGIRTYDHLNNFPIIAKRDKQKNLIGRFIDRQVKNIKRKASQLKSILKN